MASLLALHGCGNEPTGEDWDEGRAGLRSREVRADVVNDGDCPSVTAPVLPEAGFAPQAAMGCTAGDGWEPALAADQLGHVYLLYTQYQGVPGCATCGSPSLLLQVSEDGGDHWGPARPIYPSGGGQWDPQIVVDPQDGQTLFAAWLQDNKSDTVVARSDDFGDTWRVVVANHTKAGTDKPILAVRGNLVVVAFNHAQRDWFATSHDGGATFTSASLNSGQLGWSLPAGGTILGNGRILFSWDGYERNGSATGPVNLYLTPSGNGGASWQSGLLDVSSSPPACDAEQCGWAYLGAQMTLGADSSDGLYAVWNAGRSTAGPERIYLSRSVDRGASWSAPFVDLSTAPSGYHHAFPAVVAGDAGQVHVFWMSAPAVSGPWTTWYRGSADGGRTWSAAWKVSSFAAGFPYVTEDGFAFPFGDYFEADLGAEGVIHVVMGEGANYDSPGRIFYTRADVDSLR